ncbi:hypothetical protein [Microbulbifer variabilis]|uniref:hypothetical protein n=1 Tax=Microbulbifer variabilis TaxID=266805 RepID=UPI00035E971B|nr:hypothetical protein [Microbulbifer variabilis]
MNATIFVHPTAMSPREIERLEDFTGKIAIIHHKGRSVRLVQPKPTYSQHKDINEFPPFGGDAA